MNWQDHKIIKRLDGTFEITHNGYPYHVIEADPLFVLVAEFYESLPDDAKQKTVEIVPPEPVVSDEQRKAEHIEGLKALIKIRLDTWARENGFDSIHTAVGYAGDIGTTSDPLAQKFISDGNHAKAMMIQTWAIGLALINQYEVGETGDLTDEQLLAALPTLSWEYQNEQST